MLCYKGWVDLRNMIVATMGPADTIYIHLYVFLGSIIGSVLFIVVAIANYQENKDTALLTVNWMRWSDLKKWLKIAKPLHVAPELENVLQAWIYDITQK